MVLSPALGNSPRSADDFVRAWLGRVESCFREAFDRLHLLDCNLVAPDNLGYGRSSVARNGDYSFRAQIARLANLVSQLGLHRLTLVGHSLGGNLATYWSKSDR